MKKLLFGIVAGVALVCLYKKLEKDGCLDDACDQAHGFMSRSRKHFRNAVDAGKNEADYLRDRAEYTVSRAKDKLNDMVND